MEMRIEVVMLPVADVDRSKVFYESLGFILDHDVQPSSGMRVVQFTPPGSACSIVFGTGFGGLSTPGSVRNTHLVVADADSAREELVARGIAVSEVEDMGGIKYAYFADPDGNTWAVQSIDPEAGLT